MIRFLRKSLNYGLSLLNQNQVVQNKQRKHNVHRQNTTLRRTAVAQARVFTERELKRVLSYIQSQPHATRNRCMVLMTHWAGMRVGEVAARGRQVFCVRGAERLVHGGGRRLRRTAAAVGKSV